MNTKRFLLLSYTLWLHSITLTFGLGKFSLDRVYSLFGKYSNEAIIEKTYQIAKPATLTINNIDGDINITTEWKRDSICLKAVKKAAKEEQLDLLSIKTKHDTRFDGNNLTLKTVYTSKDAKGSITYNLIVPNNITLNLHTDRGIIRVNDVNGAIIATTQLGNIELKNIGNTITAQTEEQGTILIEKAQGNIKATTNKGDITITDASKSIIATTQKGNITTACTEVPATSKIVLNSQASGGIMLALPSTVNATLQGKTAHGKLTSDHYVTIKPYTTKLGKAARREFEKQVDGILGTGEAEIHVTSNHGNIKIIETKTT
jgi:hypothetical protein